jgi:hypothetical protein
VLGAPLAKVTLRRFCSRLQRVAAERDALQAAQAKPKRVRAVTKADVPEPEPVRWWLEYLEAPRSQLVRRPRGWADKPFGGVSKTWGNLLASLGLISLADA